MREFYVGERVQVRNIEDIPAEKVNKTVILNCGSSGEIIDRYSLDGDDYIYIIKFDGDKISSGTAFTAEMLEAVPLTSYELKTEIKDGKLFLYIYEDGKMVNHSYGKIFDNTKKGFATAIVCAAKLMHSFITNPITKKGEENE